MPEQHRMRLLSILAAILAALLSVMPILALAQTKPPAPTHPAAIIS